MRNGEGGARGDATRARIVDAAERLFVDRGLAGTSLRAVTAAAGVNLAAINYHFGSKEELFRVVLHRVIGAATEEQARRLEDLLAGGDPSVEQVLEAFADPLAGVVGRHGGHDEIVARIVGRILFGVDAAERSASAPVVADVDERYLAALRGLLPDLDDEELRIRFRAAITVLTSLLVRERAPRDGTAVEVAPHERVRTIAFLAAGFRAPACAPG